MSVVSDCKLLQTVATQLAKPVKDCLSSVLRPEIIRSVRLPLGSQPPSGIVRESGIVISGIVRESRLYCSYYESHGAPQVRRD